MCSLVRPGTPRTGRAPGLSHAVVLDSAHAVNTDFAAEEPLTSIQNAYRAVQEVPHRVDLHVADHVVADAEFQVRQLAEWTRR